MMMGTAMMGAEVSAEVRVRVVAATTAKSGEKAVRVRKTAARTAKTRRRGGECEGSGGDNG